MLANNFYTVHELNLEGNQASAQIELQAQHPIFGGHFPGEAVVPGVTMIRICEELLSLALKKQYRIKESKTIKFLSVINPELDSILKVYFQLKQDAEQILADFSFVKPDGVICFKMNALLQASED
jgi:3-hydroxyacyl-[acyl-carrier-protein] dehydratase